MPVLSGICTKYSLCRRTPISVLSDDGPVRLPLHPRACLEVLLVHEEGHLAILSLRGAFVPYPVHVGAIAPLDHLVSCRVDL